MNPECALCDAVIVHQARRIESLERELKQWRELTMEWRRRAGEDAKSS